MSLNVTGNMSYPFMLFSLWCLLPPQPCTPPQYSTNPEDCYTFLQSSSKSLQGFLVSSFVKLSLLGRTDQLSRIGTLCLLTLKYWLSYSMASCLPMSSQCQSQYAKGLTHRNCSPKCLWCGCKINEWINYIKFRLFSNSVVFLSPLCGNSNSREDLTNQNAVTITLTNAAIFFGLPCWLKLIFDVFDVMGHAG